MLRARSSFLYLVDVKKICRFLYCRGRFYVELFMHLYSIYQFQSVCRYVLEYTPQYHK